MKNKCHKTRNQWWNETRNSSKEEFICQNEVSNFNVNLAFSVCGDFFNVLKLFSVCEVTVYLKLASNLMENKYVIKTALCSETKEIDTKERSFVKVHFRIF